MFCDYNTFLIVKQISLDQLGATTPEKTFNPKPRDYSQSISRQILARVQKKKKVVTS